MIRQPESIGACYANELEALRSGRHQLVCLNLSDSEFALLVRRGAPAGTNLATISPEGQRVYAKTAARELFERAIARAMKAETGKGSL